VTVLPWVLGAVVLAGLAAAPVAGTLVRRRRTVAAGRDRARSLCSRLEVALDGTDAPEPARREARRCLLLAGAALAGRPGPADVARAADWARTGLAALDEPT